LPGSRHVPHIADSTDHQGVEIVTFHAGQHFCAPVRTKAGEVDTGVVLEAHRPDEQTSVTRDRAHAVTP
jgi:hypothetical protein